MATASLEKLALDNARTMSVALELGDSFTVTVDWKNTADSHAFDLFFTYGNYNPNTGQFTPYKYVFIKQDQPSSPGQSKTTQIDAWLEADNIPGVYDVMVMVCDLRIVGSSVYIDNVYDTMIKEDYLEVAGEVPPPQPAELCGISTNRYETQAGRGQMWIWNWRNAGTETYKYRVAMLLGNSAGGQFTPKFGYIMPWTRSPSSTCSGLNLSGSIPLNAPPGIYDAMGLVCDAPSINERTFLGGSALDVITNVHDSVIEENFIKIEGLPAGITAEVKSLQMPTSVAAGQYFDVEIEWCNTCSQSHKFAVMIACGVAGDSMFYGLWGSLSAAIDIGPGGCLKTTIRHWAPSYCQGLWSVAAMVVERIEEHPYIRAIYDTLLKKDYLTVT